MSEELKKDEVADGDSSIPPNEPADGASTGVESSGETPELTTTEESGNQAEGSEDTAQTEVPLAPAEGAASAQQIETLEKEKQELYERLLRKQAEFENFRKRTEKEKHEFFDYTLFHFVQGVLPVLDGLERGLAVTEGETVENYKKGIELILKQFRDLLSGVGVQPIRATGKMFDPNLHQAVMREENGALPENEIIEELQRGYTFKERLLRPSMVKVAVPASDPDDAENVAAEPTPETADEESLQ